MKFTPWFIISATSFLLDSAQAVQVIYGSYEKEGVEYLGARNSDSAECKDKASVIDTFHGKNQNKTHGICVASNVWNQDLKANLPELVEAPQDKTAKWITALAFMSNYEGPYDHFSSDKLYAPYIVSQLSESALSKVPDDARLAGFFEILIPYMSSEQIGQLDRSFINRILASGTIEVDRLGAILNKFSGKMLQDHSEEISKAVTTNNLSLPKLAPGVLRVLFRSNSFCNHVAFAQLLHLGSRPEQAKLLPHECMSSVMSRMQNGTCDLRLRFFPPQAFASLSTALPNKECYSYLTRDHIESWGAKNENPEERCTGLQVEALNTEAISAIDENCLFTRFDDHNLAPGPIQLGGNWGLLRPEILSRFKGEQKLIERIHPNDWEYITVSQKQVLADDSNSWAYLPANFFYYNGHVKLTREAFEGLSDEAKGPALRFADLAEDALSNVTSMAAFRCYKDQVGDDGITGMAIFDYSAYTQPKLPKLIENLSSNQLGDHACRDIESVKALKDLKAIQLYATRACFDNIKEKIEPEHLPDLHPRIGQLLPLVDMVRSMDESKWGQLDCKGLQGLLEATDYCKEMSAGKWNNIREECLGKLDAKCISQVTCWNDLKSNVIRAIPPAAFRLNTVDTAPEPQHLEGKQLVELGADVTDLQKHPATNWTAVVISGMDSSTLALVPARTFAALKEEVYEAITARNIASISAKAMADMRLDQVKRIKPEAFANLRVDQANEIGKNVTGSENPVCWLSEQKVSDQVKKVLRERCSGNGTPADKGAEKEDKKDEKKPETQKN